MLCFRKQKRLAPVVTQSSMESTVSSASLKVLAAQTLKIASINGLGDTEKLDLELEDEIRWEETKASAHETVERLRKRCHNLLHGRRCLLIVVFLNILDCCLVMGELVLDFRHMSNGFAASQQLSLLMLAKLNETYPAVFFNATLETVEVEKYLDQLHALFDQILSGYVFFFAAGSNYTDVEAVSECSSFLRNRSVLGEVCSSSSNNNNISGSSNLLEGAIYFWNKQPHGLGVRPEHTDLLKVVHILHYTSITILSVLVFETALKIACVGKRFLKKKLEMFDAFIILVSFVLDLVFVEGIADLSIDKFFVIVSFLLPWRVLRVVNSLVVAVSDQHMFNMKMLFKQKRKALDQLHDSQEQNATLEKHVQILKDLCTSRGVQEWELSKALGQSLAANGGGGLKALSKLVFQAAESFAPLSGSTNRSGLVTACTTPEIASLQSSPAPSVRTSAAAAAPGAGGTTSALKSSASAPTTTKLAGQTATTTTTTTTSTTIAATAEALHRAVCNGDLELGHLPRANGHAHVLHAPAVTQAEEDEEGLVSRAEVQYEPVSRSGRLDSPDGLPPSLPPRLKGKGEEERECEAVDDPARGRTAAQDVRGDGDGDGDGVGGDDDEDDDGDYCRDSPGAGTGRRDASSSSSLSASSSPASPRLASSLASPPEPPAPSLVRNDSTASSKAEVISDSRGCSPSRMRFYLPDGAQEQNPAAGRGEKDAVASRIGEEGWSVASPDHIAITFPYYSSEDEDTRL